MLPEQNLPVPESNPDGDQNQISLLDLEDGVAVLFADQPPTNFELIPFQLVGQNTANQILERLGAAASCCASCVGRYQSTRDFWPSPISTLTG